MKSLFNSKALISPFLIGAASFCYFHPSAAAWEVAQSEASFCPNANSQELYVAETRDYALFICSAENNRQLPKYYIGAPKDGSRQLTITLSNYDRENEIFVANNGEYTYTLDFSRRRLMVRFPNGRVRTDRLVNAWGPEDLDSQSAREN
ncbi:MAG: hypothetical protein SAL07_20075 [Oscillatoria sp. PMC 1051.18]|nr:hypothetical protein [Oscillatoria sp. PMC 1050.18]MEC5032203.1 hypothetical protein [Oscillatoria sp. PMC 1051.18]